MAYRVGYALRLRTGILQRRTPTTEWSALPLQSLLSDGALAKTDAYNRYRLDSAPRFFFAPHDRIHYSSLFARWDVAGTPALIAAEDAAVGRFRYFENAVVAAGFPPNWHANPFTGEVLPAGRHWSAISDFGAGDIKVIWELSRFGFSYALARAYWRTGDERFAEVFWRLVEDWREHNPPNCGPNWKCGQETSLRVMAWCFGLYSFLDSSATTAARVAALAQMIAASGRRIAANFDYALSQHNNHGISEALGLWTIAVLFPELQAALGWAKMGRSALEAQGRTLIYDDGAFSQHSVNYQRLMLHDYLWAIRLGDLNGQPLSAELRRRVGQSAALLYQLQDEDSGSVPHYGQNDGALILPLNNCRYHDFRPVIQAAHYLTTGHRRYVEGPWDEDLLWLFGPDALRVPADQPRRTDLQADSGGYYTLRSPESFAFTRCAAYRHRPGQADMLHVDIWWRGQNIALDAGTYSYNAHPPWDNTLGHTAYHNTVSVDGLNQMDRIGRFLWLPWARGQARHASISAAGCLAYWEGEHDGYKRLKPPVRHRRGILRLNDGWWLVLDKLESRGEHTYRLHWLFSDLPYDWEPAAGRLRLHFTTFPYHIQLASGTREASYSLVRADGDSPRGWHAPYYQTREPALSLDLTIRTATACFWTLFGPGAGLVEAERRSMKIRTDAWEAALSLGDTEDEPLTTGVTMTGGVQDYLDGTRCASC